MLPYLGGHLALDDLRRRFMSIAWGLADERVIHDNPLTAKTSLYLSEFSRGHRTEAELRRLLLDLSSTLHVRYVVNTSSGRCEAGAAANQTFPLLLPQVELAGR
jgi:hypothetical protein